MENPLIIDLSELLKMFWKYRRRLNSAEPAQQELYDALIELDRSVLEKVRQLRDLYWNVLQKQTLSHRHKADRIKKAAVEWEESLPEESSHPTDLYEEFTVELSRPRELPPWGINIIGGEEDPEDPGIYISDIIDNSIAQKCGALLPCDRIIEVNGTETREVNHEVAKDLLRVREETLEIKILRKGFPPEPELQFDILDVYLSTDNPSKGFGIAIKGGKDDQLIQDHDGIFITHVSGVAAENGQLDKGDRIISANSTNLEHVAREVANSTITSCPHMLHLKVQKRALLQLAPPDVVSSCIRQVVLKSYGGNYGLSVGGTAGKIYIIRLTSGGAAEKNGHIFLGDQVVAVGDNSTLNCSVDQIHRYLQNYPQQICLKLAHAQREFNSLLCGGLITHSISNSSMREIMNTDSFYFKANFDYNPKLDRECPNHGLELTVGMIVRIDDCGDIVKCQNQRDTPRSLQDKWYRAVLVEDTHERLEGFIPSSYSLHQVRYPGVTLSKSRSKSSRKWLPTRKSDIRKTWQKHTFYSQIWKTEIDETRVILIVGVLNNLLVEMFIREYPDTYQTLLTLPPGVLELGNNSLFSTACMNIIASKKHVLIAIGPELLQSFIGLNPIVIVTYPVGVRTGSDMEAKSLSTSDGLLDASQLEQGQITANQIRNDFGIDISGIASGTNLGEIFYQVHSIINDNSYKKIIWSDKAPERKSKGFGPLSESTDLLETLSKVSS